MLGGQLFDLGATTTPEILDRGAAKPGRLEGASAEETVPFLAPSIDDSLFSRIDEQACLILVIISVWLLNSRRRYSPRSVCDAVRRTNVERPTPRTRRLLP
jgi:hypothetical protein